MKRFVIGDIHGRLDALNEVLKKSGFDFDNDKLICLGDVCDGDDRVKECIDVLLKVKNLIFILGNHDAWAKNWMRTGEDFSLWWNQGGEWTAKSYGFQIKNVPKAHYDLLDNAPLYYEEDGMLFVHGGIKPFIPIKEQDPKTLIWDRSIIDFARYQKIPGFKHVFIGHSTTELIVKERTYPLTFNNLTMVDTGAGWTGKLSMIDLDSGEIFQSQQQTPKR